LPAAAPGIKLRDGSGAPFPTTWQVLMWQSRHFWVVLVVATAIAVAVSARSFERAFPLVTIELEMDRRSALERAAAIAASHGWETAGSRQAASFGQRDEELKRYVELEAGGPSAWSRLISSGDHHAYQWRVRQFREGATTEAEVRFAADGSPWGFRLTLPEDAPGATLAPERARVIAEAVAMRDWGVDLGVYEPVESRQELRPGGRLDHWFVYERPAMGYGEARFRLRLGVAGDITSEVSRFVEVPETFQRRHAEMRSANNLIALIASVSAGVLYLVLGAGVGLVVLLRRRWVLWRQPLLWGGVVGGLMMAASLNELPLQWMGYDTAISRSGFLATQLLGAFAAGVGTTLFVALVIMAGESLTRRAFPDHVQLWRTWSPDVAGSRHVLGMTLGGYVFAGLFVAYAVGFYLFANGVLGWPVSGESVLHPDVLATPFPWLSAVAISLMAGFSEEAMFRAIPLAGAALIAARFGRRGGWLAVALVVQALIFAAAHANYPQQPSYARVVELFIPAMALGLVFIRWGFLPAVVAHFAYDMVWFSLPVFASSAPGTWVNQGLLIGLGLLPLGIVLAARYRHGASDDAVAGARNAAWRPAEPLAEPRSEAARGGVPASPGSATGATYPGDAGPAAGPADGTRPDARTRPGPRPTLPAGLVRWAPALGLAGVLAWAATTGFRPDPSPLAVGAGTAVESARTALVEARLIDASPGTDWRLLPTTHTGRTPAHRFVHETAGPDGYATLVGSHLPDPHWHVRAARFDGELDARAEEFLVEVDGQGTVYRVRHTLPEERPGEALTEAEARAIALAAAERLWSLSADDLWPISAAASQRPARVDWMFTFRTPATSSLVEGEARARVAVAGDRVTDAVRFVHIPEQWERERRAARTRAGIISGIALAMIVLLGVAAIIVGAGRLGRRQLPLGTAGVGLAIGTALVGINTLNGWPGMVASFSTSEPYSHQIAGSAAGLGFLALMAGILAGLFLALAHAWAGEDDDATTRSPDWRAIVNLGIPAGAILAAVFAAAGLVAAGAPAWPSYDGADAMLPALAAALRPLQALFLRTLFALLALGALARMPARGRRGIPARALLAVGIGLMIGDALAGEAVLTWLAASALGAALLLAGLRLVRHAGAAIVPPLIATVIVLGQMPAIAHGAFPGARTGLIIGSVLTAVAAAAWARALPGAPAAGVQPGGAVAGRREAVAAGGGGD
jgi:membrane protease YdiL (CAAX protease family)